MTTLHIIITALIALALWWLLKDYSTWRQKQLQMAKRHKTLATDLTPPSAQQQQEPANMDNSTENDALAPNTDKTSEQQDTACQQSNDGTVASTIEDHSVKTPTLNLAQYTLMIPMAVVYLVGRTMIDVARGCLYHLLYKTEQAVPVVDAWLFEKVTVWLPKKYDQAEVWWTTTGREMYHNWQHTLIYHTIPTTIDYIDAFFLNVYNGGQLLMETAQKIGDSLRLFREKHDWQQLAMDMGNISYTLLWQPFVSTVTRIHQLGKLFCQGCWYGLKATWDDLRWAATVGLPMIFDWIKTTRGWVWMTDALHWCQALAKVAIFNIILVTAPVFYWLGQWMVRLGDVFGSWIQSEWVQDIWRHIRYALANSGVWLGGELVALVQSIKTMTTTMVDNGLVPIIQLFMNHVLPRLSDGYQRFMTETYVVYRHYVQPAVQQLITWCGKALWPLTHLLERYYQVFLSFLSRWQWDGILQVSAVITQSLQWMMGWLVGSMGPAINKTMSTLVYHHLPLAVEYVQYGWNKMLDNLDTSAMVCTAEQLYQVIQEQCILLFASLERTMNEWKEAQQESDTLADKGKGSKIS